MKLRTLVGMALALPLAVIGGTASAGETPVKIGVLSDMSSLYSDLAGKGSVEAAKMAAADAGWVVGEPVEVIAADHQNKPDVASSIAGEWYDRQGVDLITDLVTSSVALAVEGVSRDKKKVAIIVTAASSDITGPKCS